jgi:ABC-type uncharacterized transport system auxiliary subunit
MKALVTPVRFLVMPAKAGIQFLLLLSLSGCFGSSPPIPEDIYYRLQPSAPAQRFDTPRVGLVVVDRPSAASVFTARDIAYSDAAPNLRLQHYHYHHWIDPPPQLLQQALVDYLRAANLARAVTSEPGRQPAAWRVSGMVRRFERLSTGSGWQASVSLELRADGAGAREPRLLRQYDVVIGADGDSMEATAQAFAKAIGSVFDKFLADFSAALPADAARP